MLASLVQWQNSRLPRGRPGFNSRTMQSFLVKIWNSCIMKPFYLFPHILYMIKFSEILLVEFIFYNNAVFNIYSIFDYDYERDHYHHHKQQSLCILNMFFVIPIVLYYSQPNTSSLCCSRSVSTTWSFAEQFLFGDRFCLHSNTLLPLLEIKLTIGRCI